VLALDADAQRSDSGLQNELQGSPRSADSWTTVTVEHQEFFRVGADDKPSISLVTRHVMPAGEGPRRKLEVDFIAKLIGAAIDLHDREQTQRAF
jgi:hypothetical protein